MMGKLRVDPWLYYIAALLVLTLPLRWLLAALTAGAFHELCHLAAVRGLGGQVLKVRLKPGGAAIDAVLPGQGRELLAVLAGPVGSLLLLGVHRWFLVSGVGICLITLLGMLLHLRLEKQT